MGIFDMSAMQEENNATSTEPEKKVEATEIGDNKVQIKDTENKVVELNGSLSSVYTNALDQMYSNESVGGIINMIRKRENDEAAAATGISNDDLYVNIVDKDELENGDIGKVADGLRVALDKQTCKNKMVVLESHKEDNRTKLLTDYLKSKGVACVRSRTTALEAIKDFIKV